jgi:hypothetical protein
MGSVNSINPEESDEIQEYIIKRLAGGVHPEDVTWEICERTGLMWPEAQSIVAGIQAEGAQAIAKRQFPLLGGISIIISISGLVIALWGAIGLITLVIELQSGVVVPESMYPAKNVPTWINTAIEQIGVGVKLFQIQFIQGYIEAIIIGILMMLGGYLGMRRSLETTMDDVMAWINKK